MQHYIRVARRRINGWHVPIDWESVERDYRAGTLSLREVAARHAYAHSTIANRASIERWERRVRAGRATVAMGRLLTQGSEKVRR